MSIDSDERERAFAEQLAGEVEDNKDAIAEILNKSKVGQCGGKCKGFREANFSGLCPECLQELEIETAEIFSVSPELGLLGDIMDSRD